MGNIVNGLGHLGAFGFNTVKCRISSTLNTLKLIYHAVAGIGDGIQLIAYIVNQSECCG